MNHPNVNRRHHLQPRRGRHPGVGAPRAHGAELEGLRLQALDPGEMKAIEKLETGASLFLDHRDPATVKWLGELRMAG